MINSSLCEATCRVSRKAKKGSRPLKSVDGPMPLLPFASAFKSSAFKVLLLLGYLLSTFLRDVIIRVSFKLSFLHLYGLVFGFAFEQPLSPAGK